MAKISSAQFLTQLLKNPQAVNDCGNVNFTNLAELATFSQISPYIFTLLKTCATALSAEDYLELKQQYLHSLRKNLIFWNTFLTINAEFKKNRIPLVPLKGMDTLIRFYPSFETRMMVDIDVLIKEEYYQRACQVLEKLGFQKMLDGLKESYWRIRHCHVKFYKEPVCVELHWGLDCKRSGVSLLPHLWTRTLEIKVQDQAVTVLSAEDALLSFALHLRRFGEILSLKQVLDAGGLINETKGFAWDYIVEQSIKCHLRATVFFFLTQVALYTNATIPQTVIQRLAIPQWKKKNIKNFIIKHTLEIKSSPKQNYLKAHFLLYDTVIEPLWYVITIPYEQFCKFYDLSPYTKKTDLFYSARFLYIPLKQFLSYF